jgi:uncharacterized protein
MEYKNVQRVIETTLIGYLGGYLFSLAHFPLPWVLGALTFVLLWQGFTKRKAYCPNPVKQGGFLILGMYFGLYFTIQTFLTIGPYIIPYLFMTFILIFASIFIATIVTKWVQVDKITSVFGSIPGGLSEMVLASEALNAKASYVVIFQTVRLLTVLFTVPALIVFYFNEQGQGANYIVTEEAFVFGGFSYLWYVIPIFLGILVRDRIPAGIVVAPLAITAAMNISVIDLASIPSVVLLSAQVAVGIGLGKNISFEDLKLGGKYCLVYFGVSLTLIVVSFGLGATLATFTSLDLATAMLSIAPGGLIEMVLTASTVGGDPAVVSALQLIRILVIIILVPSFLKWYFRKDVHETAA